MSDGQLASITDQHDQTVTRTPLTEPLIVNFDDMKVEATIDNLVEFLFTGKLLENTAEQRKILIELTSDSQASLPIYYDSSDNSPKVKTDLFTIASVLLEEKSELHKRMRTDFFNNNWIEFKDPNTGHWLSAYGTSEDYSDNIELDRVITVDTEMYSVDSWDIDLDYTGVESAADIGLPIRSDRTNNDGRDLINDFNFYTTLGDISPSLLDEEYLTNYAFVANRDAHVMFQDKSVVEKYDVFSEFDKEVTTIYQTDMSVDMMINEAAFRYRVDTVSPYFGGETEMLGNTFTERALRKIARSNMEEESNNLPNLLINEDNIAQFLFSNNIFDRHRLLWAR